jgi:uncharacterized protein (TIGR02421 family)
MSAETLADLLSRVSLALSRLGRRTRLLGDIAWPRAVEEQFFRDRADRLPAVEYALDRDGLDERARVFEELASSVDGDSEVHALLRDTARSFADANRLLRAAGTHEFYRRSRELYGGARTRFVGSAIRNIDLAEHLLERLAEHRDERAEPPAPRDEPDDPRDEALEDPARPSWTADRFAQWIRDRNASRAPRPFDLDVLLDPDLSARVVAGRSRVRIRSDCVFSPWEAEGLWAHEIETHVLSAQNGALQRGATFLAAGGPRTTRTQEGLAVFAELEARRLGAARMRRLAMRVKLVAAAEDGADFIAVYRMLVDAGSAPRDAFLDAQRVFRGGRVEGGAPFTKDACYLPGLVEVYTFLAMFARSGRREDLAMLLAGRCAIDDLDALVALRREGLLEPPRHLPTWFANWRGLLPYFAFTSFAQELPREPVEARFAPLLALAARPPDDRA